MWVGTGFSMARVAEGGEVLQRVELPDNRAPFALMLGGEDRRTLFIMTAEYGRPTATWPTSIGLPTGPVPERS